jgi:hypothetical protein
MNGIEIITLLSSNPIITSAVSAVSGALITAIFLRHNTSANEFEKIKAGKFKEATDELIASGKMTYTEYYKANNFLKVAKKADEYYSESPHTDNFNSYDFDWFIRFYEAVGNISNEEMQDLWAKILAGEISHPSTYSLHTIDVLKNLRKKDAELFERICAHSICSGDKLFLPYYNDYLYRCGIQYSDIMQLSEQDLIYNDSMLVLKIRTSNEIDVAFSNKNLLMTHRATDENIKEFNIKQFPFTRVGYEIAFLKNICTSDDDFISFAREINKNNQVTIGVHRIIGIHGNQIQYETSNMIEEHEQSIVEKQ